MKKLAHILMFLVLSIALIFGTLFIILSTDKGQNYATSLLQELLTKNIGHKVKITNLRISFPLKISLKYFSIADERGEWLKVENAEIGIMPVGLLHSEIIISELKAKSVTLLHLPEFSATREATPGPSKFGISLREIELPLVVINSRITGLDKDLNISLDGKAVYDHSQKITFEATTAILSGLSDLLKNTKVIATGSYDITGKLLVLNKSQVKNENFSVDGNIIADFQGDSLDGKYEVELKDLNKIDKNLIGNVKDRLNIAGTLQHPVIDGTLKAHDLKYGDKTLPDLSLSHQLQYDVVGQAGTINVSDQEQELALNTNFSIKDDNINLNPFELLYKQNSITGELKYNSKFSALAGMLEATSNDLNIFSQFLNNNVRGEAQATIKFAHQNKIQSLEVKVDSNNLSFDEFSAALVNADINIEDLWSARLNTVNVKVEDISYKEKPILKSTSLECNKKDKTLDFILKGKGSLSKQLDFETYGNFTAESDKKLSLNLTKIAAKYGNNEIKGSNPLAIKYDNEEVKYAVSNLYVDKGKISAHGVLSNKGVIDSTISLKQLPLFTEGTTLHKEFANSKLDGEIILTGKAAAPIINAHLNILDINLTPTETAQLVLNSNYRENTLAINFSIKSPGKNYGDLKIMLPMQLSLMPYKIEIAKDKKIEGNINLNLNIDSLAALLVPPIHRFKGQLDTNLKIAGSLDNPQVTGKISIKDGKYEHIPAGIKIKNISALVEARGRSIIVQEFKAYDSENSTLKGTGKWDLNKKDMPFNISLAADNFYFMNHANVQATVNGRLQIIGNMNRAKITGDIEPAPLEIQLPEQFKKEIPELNIVKVVLAPGEEEETIEQSFLDSYEIDTNITLTAKHKIFIRGWGLDTELGGKIDCTGLINNPEIKGKLETIRGRYQEFGKQFTLKEGRLDFEGPIPPSPYLNIIGSIVQDNTEIKVILSGHVLTPKLSIESSPPMPQEEALSILLFGKQTTQISPFQAVQLADSLRRLSGQGGGGINILNKARGILKVDDIKFKNDSNDNKDAALGIGKYLTDKVYLEIEKGTQAGTGKTRVEVEIRNNLSVESSVGESGANSIGINWRKDY